MEKQLARKVEVGEHIETVLCDIHTLILTQEGLKLTPVLATDEVHPVLCFFNCSVNQSKLLEKLINSESKWEEIQMSWDYERADWCFYRFQPEENVPLCKKIFSALSSIIPILIPHYEEIEYYEEAALLQKLEAYIQPNL